MRISEHNLLIETRRYSKGSILPREERTRICCISILLILKSDVFVLVSIYIVCSCLTLQQEEIKNICITMKELNYLKWLGILIVTLSY